MRVSPTTYGRQRAIVEEGHLLLVVHRPPKATDATREGVLYWRNPAGEWQASRGAPGQNGLKRLVLDYAALEASLTESYEKAADATTLFSLLDSVTPAARAAHNLHVALQAAREGIQNDLFLIELRDMASDVDRNFELLHDDVRHAIQYRSVREAEAQARLSQEAVRASHRLNILAALFLPLTAIGSVFGMNLVHGLNDQSPFLFWFVLACGIGLGAGMMAWVLAKPKDGLPPKPKA